ncbi:MAG TPA: hypothetical protein VKZ99_04815 [Gammaproteobacteria bacterium]|nr:hypothetical protein [Gammaproteobacteria bacterium]
MSGPEARRLQGVSDNREAAAAVAGEARRALAIFSHELEPQVYDTLEFLEAAKALALSASRARIRILLVDSTRAVREGHRLVELARRLSSFFEIRKPHPDDAGIPETFIIADEKALLHRPLATRWEGQASLHDPLRAREKLKLFEEIWQRSEPDPEMRQLRI